MKTSRRTWLGLGAAILIDAAASKVIAADAHKHAAAPAKPVPGSGGEGGEVGGERGGAKAELKPSLRFARAIAFIRGHLLVGDELIRQGQWNAALPHFLHPLEEIYGGIAGDLATYGVRPFESALRALVQTVRARKLEAYDGARALVAERLATADAGLAKVEPDRVPFTVAVALEVLKQATEEYREAVERGRIAKAVEYQDARGFVWHAEALIESVSTELAAKDAEALAKTRTALTTLKAAWPTAVPPKKLVKDVSAVMGDVARVELYAGNFL